MNKVKIYGAGGQGVVTLGKILCSAAGVHDGNYAKTMPEYGHERRGGSVFADVIIDDTPILMNSFIYDPEIVLVLDPSVHGTKFDVTSGVGSDATLLLNADNCDYDFVSKFKKVYYADVSDISLNILGRDFPNLGMVGLFLNLNIIKKESLIASLKDTFGANSEKYISVMESGYNGTKQR